MNFVAFHAGKLHPLFSALITSSVKLCRAHNFEAYQKRSDKNTDIISNILKNSLHLVNFFLFNIKIVILLHFKSIALGKYFWTMKTRYSKGLTRQLGKISYTEFFYPRWEGKSEKTLLSLPKSKEFKCIFCLHISNFLS